jgi:four helix bundle protein
MAFKFENLLIWQKAFDLADCIHMLTKNFPKDEMFSLSSQIRRAADSVVLNISEGSTGSSNTEFARFLNIALRSAIEVVACSMLAKRRKYITDEEFNNLYNQYEQLCRMITTFRNRLQ